ncbi:MAG: 23S rRNA (adenine(2503)-C(2))-methyltransferase RlmN [Balneolaceae bacterium]|nr:23S rRNA (adenine(2503)-C(2))-methyltransferase RlmN [Balneolaceae bacterium]
MPETVQKTDLKQLTKEQLHAFCSEMGLQSYRADQIFQWLYQKGVSSFDEMTNLSKDLRAKLDEIARINRIEPVRQQESKDGTIKFLFRLQGDNEYKIESVLIPDFYPDGAPNRLTVCVSSQVGCVFGCSFCATGKMGFLRNLTHGEIVDQVQYINEVCRHIYNKDVTNIVYMGMGEPLHNYRPVVDSADILTDEMGIDLSPKRITISTVGLTKQIKKLADERHPYNLAISLHAADDEKRDEIMPINQSMNLRQLKEAVQYYYSNMHRPITYEYLLFEHFNDSPSDAQRLAEIARWAPSKVNIIMYNKVEGVELQRAREDRLDAFMQELVDRDVTATVRRSRGDDIDAGCGQLAIKDEAMQGKTIAKN